MTACRQAGDHESTLLQVSYACLTQHVGQVALVLVIRAVSLQHACPATLHGCHSGNQSLCAVVDAACSSLIRLLMRLLLPVIECNVTAVVCVCASHVKLLHVKVYLSLKCMKRCGILRRVYAPLHRDCCQPDWPAPCLDMQCSCTHA
jgi:hypothetical protein